VRLLWESYAVIARVRQRVKVSFFNDEGTIYRRVQWHLWGEDAVSKSLLPNLWISEIFQNWFPCYCGQNNTRQATYGKCNIKTPSCNHCCSGKEISVTYSECALVALGIQHATARSILSSVVCRDVDYFSTLYHKRHYFKKLMGIKYVSFFSTTSVWNISHSKKTWARYGKKCIAIFM
jgi:hypothetical protein